MNVPGHRRPVAPLCRLLFCLVTGGVGLWVWLGEPFATIAHVASPTPTPAAVAAPKQTEFRYFLPALNVNLAPRSPKKGLAWTYKYCEDAAGVFARWVYDWGMTPKICPAPLESVPMIRDAEQWARKKTVGGNSEWILGFNEPDLCPDQACLTPAQAVPLWREIELAYPHRKLVAPAPSQLHLNWLVEFRARYVATYQTPPRLDALAAHFYGFTLADALAVLTWYKARALEYGVPEIWLTEFAFPVAENRVCFGVPYATAMHQAQQFITWLEQEPLVTRYAWYAPRIDAADPVLGVPSAECSAALYDFSGAPMTGWGVMYRAR